MNHDDSQKQHRTQSDGTTRGLPRAHSGTMLRRNMVISHVMRRRRALPWRGDVMAVLCRCVCWRTGSG
jgi:hypothetical protein